MSRGPDRKLRKTSAWSTERRLREGSELRACQVCGAEFWVSRSQREMVTGGGKYCSVPCRRKGFDNTGRRAPEVTRHTAGYLLEWAPDHPRAVSHGRVLQHILVAEAILGRPLKANEEVHHVNQRRDDNRPENLQVWKAGEHQRIHAQLPGVRERMRATGKRSIAGRRRDPVTGRVLPD